MHKFFMGIKMYFSPATRRRMAMVGAGAANHQRWNPWVLSLPTGHTIQRLATGVHALQRTTVLPWNAACVLH